MDVVLKGFGRDWATTLPVCVVPDAGSYRLEGGNRDSLRLKDLPEGATITAHLAEGGGWEEDVAFAVANRDGLLTLVRPGSELALDPAKGWPRMLAFSPWKAVIRQGRDVVETWSGNSEAEAISTARERLSEHSRQASRCSLPVTMEVVRTERMRMDAVVPDALPSGPGL